MSYSVKACNDAHLLLAETKSSTERSYETVIGSYQNEKTEIRRGPQGQTLSSV